MKKKDMYVSPQIEVIKIENEGVIASSAGVSNMPGNNWGPQSRSVGRSGYSNTTSNDLEDMINDILTIEN